MPPRDESPLSRVVRAMVNQDGFSFGVAWLSVGSRTIVLPVLRTTASPRGYRLAEEVADDVHAEDLGQIDRVRLCNDSGSRVLVRSGGLFEGSETQSRGITASVVLEPTSTEEVEVRCVHASRPIAPGAVLKLAREVAPDRVHQALLLRDQGLVWASVLDSTGSSHGSLSLGEGSAGPRAGSDDLLAALAVSSASEDPVNDFIREIPSHAMQCGVFLIDTRGVVAVEIFDHPDSWRAVSKAILKRHAQLFRPARTSPLRTTADSEAAIRLAKEFLEGLAQAPALRVRADSWVVSHPPAAYATTEGKVIHLVASRPDGSQGGPSPTQGGMGHGDLPASIEAQAPNGPFGVMPRGLVASEPNGGEVAAAAMVDTGEDIDSSPPSTRPRRRKVLTSGWDAVTFQALEHFSRKELRGDRSAAIRFLVRKGLRGRGYMGPSPRRDTPLFAVPTTAPEPEPPAAGLRYLGMETRIHDLGRIAETVEYAGWLRKRARTELERLASNEGDGPLRAAAQSALDRLTPIPREEEPSQPAGEEPPPIPPPIDVRLLLRRAFAASAGGDYSQALELFDEVLAMETNHRTALLGRAVALRRAGRAQEALTALDLVLHLEPKNAAALLNRGRILQEHGDLKGALDTFDQLVVVAPNDWDVWMARGDVLVRMGRDEDALRSYAEALRRNPDNEQLRGRIRAVEKPRVPPGPSGPKRMAMPRGVEEGQSYLVKETRSELSYRTFKALSGQGLPSLLITRQPRERVQRQYGLEGVRILTLSYGPGEDVYSPVALTALTRAVERFVEENQDRGVILLDGLAGLVTTNGFRDTMLFVERVNEVILQSHAIFLISLTPEALPDKEAALLERSLRALS